MIRTSHLAAMAVFFAATVAWPSAQRAPAPQPPAPQRALPTDLVLKPWTGDFDGMVERRLVRVLAPYSRTFFFNEMGRERGYAVDLVRVVDQFLNKKLAPSLGKRPITFVIIPTTRDRLLSGVAEGNGDIAVGNLTVTDERKKTVDFVTAPDALKMSEVVLTGPKSPVITTAEDLSGRPCTSGPRRATTRVCSP